MSYLSQGDPDLYAILGREIHREESTLEPVES